MDTCQIFFVGLSQGRRLWRNRPHRLEKHRWGELEGLRAQPRTRRTYRPQKAHVIFARNMPERTSDRQLEELQAFIEPWNKGSRLEVNPLGVFHTVDSKDRAFEAWTRAGLPCPRCWPLDSAAQVLSLLETHPRLVLRTNNETQSLGMHIVDRDTSAGELSQIVNSVKTRAAQKRDVRRDTRAIAVEYVDVRDSDGYATLARVFVLFDRIIGYFAVVSDEPVFRVTYQRVETYDRWIEANHALRDLVEDPVRESAIVQAVSSLGTNIGAVDLLLQEGSPVFLEVNPLWGSVPGPYAFGDETFKALLRERESHWSAELPNITENLDVVGFYRRMYGLIADQAERFPR